MKKWKDVSVNSSIFLLDFPMGRLMYLCEPVIDVLEFTVCRVEEGNGFKNYFLDPHNLGIHWIQIQDSSRSTCLLSFCGKEIHSKTADTSYYGVVGIYHKIFCTDREAARELLELFYKYYIDNAKSLIRQMKHNIKTLNQIYKSITI